MSEADFLSFIQERLAGFCDISKVILFGSRATGKASPDSDWDVLVIAESDLSFHKRQTLALQRLAPRNEPIDLLLYAHAEFESAASMTGSAVFWAQKEGKLLYAK